VEVVIVASPSNRHGPDTKEALRAEKHVVVEKPMAMSLGEADSMIRAAQEAGKKLLVHQNYRFNKEFLLIKELIASEKLGRVFHIRNYISTFARRNDWQTLARNGGGVLNNTCVHFIDQILQLLPGRVAQAFGDLQQIASAGDVEDHVKALLRTDAGATADIEISNAQNVAGTLPKWIVCGTSGTLSGDGKSYTLRWFDQSQVAPLEVVDGPAAGRKYGNEDKLPWQEQSGSVEEAKSIGNFYDNVTAVIREAKDAVVTPESVRETMRVITLIRKETRFTGKTKRQLQAKAQ
jgi:scyllo-inositol 2-dehydrogenase (NADP+)